MKRLLTLFSFLVSFYAIEAQTCKFEFELTDSYGDGWNGGLIRIEANGVPIDTLGANFTTGTNYIDSVSINHGDTIEIIVQNQGSWPSEMGFIVTSPFPLIVASQSAGSIVATGAVWDSLVASCTVPACPMLLNVAIQNITTTTADVYFSNSGIDTIDYEFGPVGFGQGTGTTGTLMGTTTITGFSASLCYDVYVRNNCTSSGNGSSVWTGPVTFCTACSNSPITLPYTEDFELASGSYVGDASSVYCTSVSSWDFETNSQTDGRLSFDLGYSNGTGIKGASMDEVANNQPVNSLILTLDMTSYDTSQVIYLDFYQLNHGDELHNGDSLWLRGSSSDAWINVLSLGTGNYGNWIHFADIDISSALASRGQNYTSSFQLRFGQEDNSSITSAGGIDGRTFDDIYIREILCIGSTNFTDFYRTIDSIGLTWTPGSAVSFTIEYGLAGFTPGTGTTVSTTNDSIFITGLTSATLYDFYLTDSCAAGLGTPILLSAGTVSCLPSQSCVFEFELIDSYGDGWNGGEIEVQENGIAIATLGSNFTTGSTFTEYVTICDGSSVTVVVADQGSWPSEMGYIVSSPYPAVVDSQATGTIVATGSVWGSFTASCALPSCPIPSPVGINSLSGTSVVLDWGDGGGSPLGYEVWFGASGFYQGTQSAGGFKTFVSSDTLYIDTLTAITCYEYLVRAICGPGDTSAWSTPYVFCTPCAAIVPPSIEDFSNGFLPNVCWDEADAGTPATGPSSLGSGSWALDGFGNVGTTGAVRINLWTLGKSDWVLTPQYDLSSGAAYQVEFDFGVFDYANTAVGTLGSDDEVHFLVSDDGGATWTSLAIYDDTYVTAPGGNQEIISLAAYTGGVVQFAFWATEGAVDDPEDNDIFFDNFIVRTPATCFDPSALGATNITSTAADVFWTTGGATNWNVEYGISGFMIGSGTRVTATSTTLTLNSLSPSSTFDFYVRDSCGPGDVSFWVGPYTFNTLCGAIIPPSLEDFSSGFLPNICWDEADAGTPLTGPSNFGSGSWGEDGFGNVGTTGAARINLWVSSKEDWVLTPEYDLSQGPFQAEFDFGVFDYANTAPGTLGSDDEVHFLITDDGGITWTSLAVFDNSYITASGGNHEVVSLASYTSVVQFAFWATEGTVDDPEDNDVFFDNFEVDYLIPVCDTVTNLSASNIGCDSIELSWTSNTGGSIVEWAMGGSNSTSGIVSSPYVISGLTPGTMFTISVADTCASDTSDFVNITVSTANAPKPVASFVITGEMVVGTDYEVYVDASASTDANTYTWDFGNGTSGSGELDTTRYDSGGANVITLIVSNSCGSDTVSQTYTVSLMENTLIKTLAIYPNPVTKNLNIAFDKEIGDNVNIVLMDAQGRIIMDLIDEQQSTGYSNSIDVSNLASGVYVLEVYSGDLRVNRRITVKK